MNNSEYVALALKVARRYKDDEYESVALYALHFALEKLEGIENPKGFVTQCVKNACIDWYRRERPKKLRTYTNQLHGFPGCVEDFSIYPFIEALPDTLRPACQVYFVEGLGIRLAAEKLQITVPQLREFIVEIVRIAKERL